MEANKPLTDSQKIELWEKCGWKCHPDMDYVDDKVIRYVWEYDGSTEQLPPTDLNNLFRYAVPKLPFLLLNFSPTELEAYLVESMKPDTSRLIKAKSNNLQNALALVCYEVICGK